MSRYSTYSYTPINPEKYRGENIPIIMKSSWELEFAKHCDLLPTVLSWSYETRQIPYRDPLTNKQKIYIPDFFVEVAREGGHSQHYVFEIKPMHEQLDEYARNQKDAALIARNNAKWAAASEWCDRHSAEFAVLNERDIFSWHNSRKPRVKTVSRFKPTFTATKPTKSATVRTRAATVSNSIKKLQDKIAKRKNRSTASKVAKARSIRRIRKT